MSFLLFSSLLFCFTLLSFAFLCFLLYQSILTYPLACHLFPITCSIFSLSIIVIIVSSQFPITKANLVCILHTRETNSSKQNRQLNAFARTQQTKLLASSLFPLRTLTTRKFFVIMCAIAFERHLLFKIRINF